MDRLNQLRGDQGSSANSSLDSSSQDFLTASESKYFSISDGDSSLDHIPIKDVSLASVASDTVDGSISTPEQLIAGLSPIGKTSSLLDNYKIDKHIDAANILSGGVNIFEDTDNSYDGNELIIDDNVHVGLEGKVNSEDKGATEDTTSGLKGDDSIESGIDTESTLCNKDTDIVLQIDGKNVDAIDIGNGLYLYRKEGQEELAAVQIIDTDQQTPSFKFLKVRENAERNLEVYEEIEVEVPKEVPSKSAKTVKNPTSNVAAKDVKIDESKQKVDKIAATPLTDNQSTVKPIETKPSTYVDNTKPELNFNGKPMKINEAKKSPLMTYHSTPNKEGIPLTKTMVDMQLQPSRHSDNVKKTIEVNTSLDSCKQKLLDTPNKSDVSSERLDPSKDNIDSTDVILDDKIVESSLGANDKKSEDSTVNLVPVETDSILKSSNSKNVVSDSSKSKLPIDKPIEQLASESSAEVSIALTNEKDLETNVVEKPTIEKCPLQKGEDPIDIDTNKKVSIPKNNDLECNVIDQKLEEEKNEKDIFTALNTNKSKEPLNKDLKVNIVAKEETSTEVSNKEELTMDKNKSGVKDLFGLGLPVSEGSIQDPEKSCKPKESTSAQSSITAKNIAEKPLPTSKPQVLTEEKPVTPNVLATTSPITDDSKKSQIIESKKVNAASNEKVLTKEKPIVSQTTPVALQKEQPKGVQQTLSMTTECKTPDAVETKKVDAASSQQVVTASEKKVVTASEKKVDTASEKKVDTASEKKVDTASEKKVDTASEKKVDTASEKKVDTASEKKVDTASEKKVDTASDKQVDTASDKKVLIKEKPNIPPTTSNTGLSQKPSVTSDDSKVPQAVCSPATKTVDTSSDPKVSTEKQKIGPPMTSSAPNLPSISSLKTDNSKSMPGEENKKIDTTLCPTFLAEKKETVQPISSNIAVVHPTSPIKKVDTTFQSKVSTEDKKILPPKTLDVTVATSTSPLKMDNSKKSLLVDLVSNSSTPIHKVSSPEKTLQNIVPDSPKMQQSKQKISEATSQKEQPKESKDTCDDKGKDKPDLVSTAMETEDDSIETPLIIDEKVPEYQKNSSDDLIQLSDLEIDTTVTNNPPSIELISPGLDDEPQIIGIEKSAKTPIYSMPSTGKSVKESPTVSNISKPLETTANQIGKHKNIPIIDLLKEPSAMSANKAKLLDSASFIEQHVSKALVIPMPPSESSTLIKPVNTKVSTIPAQTPSSLPKIDLTITKEAPKLQASAAKPLIVNNNNPVPFGKWTEANKQAYLNKIRETKVVSNSTSTNQIKQPFDLNSRDVLKKFPVAKLNVKRDISPFVPVKTSTKVDPKVLPKPVDITKAKPDQIKVVPKSDTSELIKQIPNISKPSPSLVIQKVTQTTPEVPDKSGSSKPKEISNQNLIDRTIEDMIKQNLPPNFPKQNVLNKRKQETQKPPKQKDSQIVPKPPGLDAIEMKMNELHGIPFIERPIHELPSRYTQDLISYSKTDAKSVMQKSTKVPSLLPINKPITQNINTNPNLIEIVSDDEVIEHEPVTGDMEINKNTIQISKPQPIPATSTADVNKSKLRINEKDFEKFARRNSFTYENSLTVSYDVKTQNKTGVENNILMSKYTVPSMNISQPKKPLYGPNPVSQSKTSAFVAVHPRMEDVYNKNSQSKLQMAYQSALTAKRHKDPVTVIEDAPVSVETNVEFSSGKLNLKGKELSPTKKPVESDVSAAAFSSCDSLETSKSSDDNKKTKHQRKQVLTPVEEPELEIVSPRNEQSPKKRRKVEETVKTQEKNSKTLMPKKSYLLGRSTTVEDNSSESNTNTTDTDNMPMSAAASAIDNLVKAAELLENQAQSMQETTPDSPASSTPMKRGRGRPRKYPLPEGAEKPKTPSPQKKPRVVRTPVKRETSSEDEDSSDFEMVMENWTMGKINQDIVCPICNKLFRSENVVFKHVKHCTGPSPNRSDSDARSLRRHRRSFESQDTDSDSTQTKSSHSEPKRTLVKPKAKFKDVSASEVIVIEDTPVKPKTEKELHTKREVSKAKAQSKINSLVCEFCGKTFRQLSYLVSHKLQHKDEIAKKTEPPPSSKSVFSCEVCKKEFRKLHHLVQHRIIHNPTTSRNRRKSSAEQSDKNKDDQESSKMPDDQSAGFRCEQCDKSFRKLYHLVEHRETHDGVNQKKNPAPQTQPDKNETSSSPQCDICKKTFRKLHHLKEHKETHMDVNSEKSDDKSVKSALSTRDIIHECSLCYMVFPNEHSLNKHFVNCQKKKRQSISKASETDEGKDAQEDDKDNPEEQILKPKDDAKQAVEPKKDTDAKVSVAKKRKLSKSAESQVEIDTKETEPKIRKESDQKIRERKESEDKNRKETENSVRKVTDDKVRKDVSEKIRKDTEEKSKKEAGEKIRKDAGEKIRKDTGEKVRKDAGEKFRKDAGEKNRKDAEDKSKKDSEPKGTKDILPKKNDVEIKPFKDSSMKETKTEEKPKPISSQLIEKLKPKFDIKETIVIEDTPKKKHPPKDKIGTTVTKRQKSTHLPLPEVEPNKSLSDDDDVRYMLNPDFKEETVESKLFMKVRSKKRSSLQIERPIPNEHIKRRISLQHPPKTLRGKPKSESKPQPNIPKAEPVVSSTKTIEKVKVLGPGTDSDDSEVKYSFPDTVDAEKDAEKVEVPKEKEKKVPRKSLVDKRKSLGGIAKRKSLAKPVVAKTVAKPAVKAIRKRTAEVEHRCDCGQLFGSAALLSRHATLTHTPPRIRKRRSPPPEPASSKPTTTKETTTKPQPLRKTSVAGTSRKSIKQDSVKVAARKSTLPTSSRKSSVRDADNTDVTPSKRAKKTDIKTDTVTKSTSNVKPRRSTAHRGVPVPEKMRKLMEKLKK